MQNKAVCGVGAEQPCRRCGPSERKGISAIYLHRSGSASELDTQLEIAKRVELASNEKLDKLSIATTRVGQMLRGLIRSLRDAATWRHDIHDIYVIHGIHGC